MYAEKSVIAILQNTMVTDLRGHQQNNNSHYIGQHHKNEWGKIWFFAAKVTNVDSLYGLALEPPGEPQTKGMVKMKYKSFSTNKISMLGILMASPLYNLTSGNPGTCVSPSKALIASSSCLMTFCFSARVRKLSKSSVI